VKVLYAVLELNEMTTKQRKQAKTLVGRRDSQRSEDGGEDANCGEQMEGQTQKKGPDPAGEKCKVAFEARQAVTSFFNGCEKTQGQRVRSIILPSMLDARGAYSKLDKISDEGTFKKMRRSGSELKRSNTKLGTQLKV
jgi:hypothetical protein